MNTNKMLKTHFIFFLLGQKIILIYFRKSFSRYITQIKQKWLLTYVQQKSLIYDSEI